MPIDPKMLHKTFFFKTVASYINTRHDVRMYSGGILQPGESCKTSVSG